MIDHGQWSDQAIATMSIGMGMLIGGAISGGAAVYSASRQAGTANRAGRMSSDAIDKQIAFEREQAERDRFEWEMTQQENTRRYDRSEAEEKRRYLGDMARLDRAEAVEQGLRAEEKGRYDAEQTRRAPYRQAGTAAVMDLAARAGLTIRPTEPPAQASGTRTFADYTRGRAA